MAGYGIGNLAALPDGRGVLFTLCNSGCVSTQIHVLDLGTGREHLLLGDAVSASYLPTGHLLYVRRDGAAMAAPFDLHDLKITGPRSRCSRTCGWPRARPSWPGPGRAC